MNQPRKIFTRSKAGFFRFETGGDLNRARWIFSIVGTLLMFSLSYLLYLRSIELHANPELWLSRDTAANSPAVQSPIVPHPQAH